MSRSIGQVQQASNVTSTNQDIIGHTSAVFRSGANYKAVGELVQRSIFTALAAAFPRNGSFSSVAQALPTSLAWAGIAYGNGMWVALATTGQIYVSNDALNWVARTNPATLATGCVWSGIAFGNGVFVAISGYNANTGLNSTVYITSPDGVTWTQRALPSAASWTAICYGIGLFVIVAGGGGTASNSSLSSPDGVTWTARTMPTTSNWSSIACSGSLMVAIAFGTAAATSTNGTTWTARVVSVSAAWLDLAVNASGLFVAAAWNPNAIATSPDGVTWTQRTPPFIKGSFGGQYGLSLAYGNGVFIMVGGNYSDSLTNAACAISYDGATWYPKVLPAALYGQIAYNGAGQFALLGGNLNTASTAAAIVYAEDLTTSDWLYLSGTPGQYVRVQ